MRLLGKVFRMLYWTRCAKCLRPTLRSRKPKNNNSETRKTDSSQVCKETARRHTSTTRFATRYDGTMMCYSSLGDSITSAERMSRTQRQRQPTTGASGGARWCRPEARFGSASSLTMGCSLVAGVGFGWYLIVVERRISSFWGIFEDCV